MTKKKSLKLKKIAGTLLAVSALSAGLALGSGSAYAITTEQAESNLTTNIYNKLADKEYVLEGGGSVKGKELFNKERSSAESGTRYDVNDDQFQDLTEKERRKFTEDLVREANEQVGENGVTTSTVQGLLQKLQTKKGMGSKLLNEIMKDTKPDFVKAGGIYRPFSGIVGTTLGIIAILIMAGVGITVVLDLAYIVVPFFRNFMDSRGDGGGSGGGFKLISDEAKAAVESSGGQGGGYRSPIGAYLKHRIIGLILLGLALLYLVQGQIYILVGYIMDLVQGFLGF